MAVAAEALELDACPPWGEQAVVVRLPTGSYRFRSVSNSQAKSIERRYLPFSADHTKHESTVECEVLRLEEPLRLDAKDLTWRDQYALQLNRSAASLTIAGTNFRAHITWGPPVESSLWTHQEMELVYPNVIENFLRVLSAYRAVAAGGLLLHSAGILVGERAHIFPGHSGTGKTTLARKARSTGYEILSDDICLLLPDDQQGYRAFPVPFAGELGTSLDAIDSEGYRLGGIHSLVQGDLPERRPLTPAAAVARLSASCPFINADSHRVPELLVAASDLARTQPVGELTIGRDTPFEIVRNLIEEVPHA